MSIASALTQLESDISNAYNSIQLKGGTIPQNKNTENLANAIASISGGSSLNIFIQDTQPSGYNGIWIADSDYAEYPIVEVANVNNLEASSINILNGTTYETVLYDEYELSYKFRYIIITDVNGQEIDVTKYYGTGSIWKEIVPYIELEYIQSTGTQCINTGIAPDSTLQMYVRALGSSFVSGTGGEILFGSRIKFSNNEFSLWWQFRDHWVYGLGTTYEQSGAFPYKNQIIDITIGKGSLTITNGTSTTTKTGGTATSSYNIYLFALNSTSISGYCLNSKIYSCKMWKNDTLVRDFVPSKDLNNVVCLYDKVTKQFVYNAGTGNFVAGAEV